MVRLVGGREQRWQSLSFVGALLYWIEPGLHMSRQSSQSHPVRFLGEIYLGEPLVESIYGLQCFRIRE